MRNPEIKTRVEHFNHILEKRLDDTNFVLPGEDIDYYYPHDIYDIPVIVNEDENNNTITTDRPDADDVDDYDKLIGATFLLDATRNPNDVATKATVVRRKTDALGNPIGTAHQNPLLDTREYVVQLDNGTCDSYLANNIAENIYSQCDADGREFNTIREIIGHKTGDHAIEKCDGIIYVGKSQHAKKTTIGWKINVEFTDGVTA